MHLSNTLLTVLLSGTPALSAAVVSQYSTVKTTITKTTTTTSPITIDTSIGGAGVKTLIPGQLTLTFEGPAYLYIETAKLVTKTVTVTSTSSFKITSTAVATTKPLAATTTAVSTTSNKPSATSSSAAVTSSSAAAISSPATTTSSSAAATSSSTYRDTCFREGSVPSTAADTLISTQSNSYSLEDCFSTCVGNSACVAWAWDYPASTCKSYSAYNDVTSGTTNVFYGISYNKMIHETLHRCF